ncbi:GAF and ANTAR domain-containing protein [Phytomonospora endophytica]|uniref:ANTAR domain-containing protein n=1 Tax=Phytomonospora endophytica TaxID=714109 RepID=A0A841FJA8_9ACTN|nr:GAF and ANTAR domain-containing protein [Phytomonospora endophytica]MBB6033642.1 hypothetical protein [Phytomonospora endophytica]
MERGDDRGAWIWTRVGLESRGAPFTVAHICDAAVAEAHVDGAAVTLMSAATVWETLYATDKPAARIEGWQLDFGEGPTVDAYQRGGPVLAPDLDSLESITRWPVFATQASGEGVKAAFAFPMQVGAIRLGALNLYRLAPGPLDGDQIADALAFADAACVLLLADAEGERTGAADLTWYRDGQSTSQIHVHQATGMVLVQLNVSAESALARLRAYAFAHNRPLAEVARDVVDRKLRFRPDTGPEVVADD